MGVSIRIDTRHNINHSRLSTTDTEKKTVSVESRMIHIVSTDHQKHESFVIIYVFMVVSAPFIRINGGIKLKFNADNILK